MKIAITKNYLEKICCEEKLIAALNDKYQFFINENFIVLSPVGFIKELIYTIFVFIIINFFLHFIY